jgi:hypothetical protein
LLSLSPPLRFPPVQSLHLTCQFFTHEGPPGWLFACAASIMPSLDLWYRSSICLPGPSCPTFSAPLVLVDVDTLRISYFLFPWTFPSLSDKWRNGRSPFPVMANGNNVTGVSTARSSRHVGYCTLMYISDRRVTGGRQRSGRTVVIQVFGLVPMRGCRSSQVGNPRQKRHQRPMTMT